MKIENMTFDQLNACFSLLIQIIQHLPTFGDDSADIWKYVIELEKQVGTAMNACIDEMINVGRQ